MGQTGFELQGTWDGQPLAEGEFGRIELRIDRSADVLELRVEASYHGDPAPEAPPGPLAGLWDYEVVELFLLGADERYLEIELGPHGHHLGLCLAGRRCIVESGLPINFRAERIGPRWRGQARLSLQWLPPGLRAANAYAIHGQGVARRYLAAHPVPGHEPDFHRLEHFAPLSRDLLKSLDAALRRPGDGSSRSQ